MSDPVAVLLLVSTGAYLGFQATIRVVVYPQLASVPGDAFVAYERAHQRLVTRVVGPLFVLAGLAAIAAFVVRPGAWSAVAAVAVAGTVGVTGLAAVPQHRRLSSGFDAAAHARLLRVDSCRLVLAGAACGAAALYALTG